jgi:uncharacterized protein
MTIVSPAEARRIAVRAQLLDGSATGLLDTIRTLGRLQIDPISTVAPPQQLVLWSRLGPYDVGELDRLLWDERKLFEWNAFIWPLEALPLAQARMRRRRRSRHYKYERWSHEFLEQNARFKRYVLRELERNGPMLSRDLQHELAPRPDEPHRWWGTREVTLMLEILYAHGVVASRAGKASSVATYCSLRRARDAKWLDCPSRQRAERAPGQVQGLTTRLRERRSVRPAA